MRRQGRDSARMALVSHGGHKLGKEGMRYVWQSALCAGARVQVKGTQIARPPCATRAPVHKALCPKQRVHSFQNACPLCKMSVLLAQCLPNLCPPCTTCAFHLKNAPFVRIACQAKCLPNAMPPAQHMPSCGAGLRRAFFAATTASGPLSGFMCLHKSALPAHRYSASFFVSSVYFSA